MARPVKPERPTLPPVPAEALRLADDQGRYHRCSSYSPAEPLRSVQSWEWRMWHELRRTWLSAANLDDDRNGLAVWKTAVVEAKRDARNSGDIGGLPRHFPA